MTYDFLTFSSVQSISHVRLFGPYGLQHTRFPCPSPTPGACSNSCPLNQWCHPTISSSVVSSSCLHSFPASGSFPVSQFFQFFESGEFCFHVFFFFYFFFNFRMVEKWYTFSRKHNSNFDFFFPRLVIFSHVAGQHNEPQLPVMRVKNLHKTLVYTFISDQLLSCVWLFATPWTAARQASLSITNT